MQDVFFARQRFGQGFAARRRTRRSRLGRVQQRIGLLRTDRDRSFLVQRQLIEQIAAFAAASEAILPRLGKLPAQMLDLLL
jgi:hypothetical protein